MSSKTKLLIAIGALVVLLVCCCGAVACTPAGNSVPGVSHYSDGHSKSKSKKSKKAKKSPRNTRKR